MPSKETPKYTVWVDTREKQPWHFNETEYCQGSESTKLDVADYTIKGLEDIFLIERKGSITEFVNNTTSVDKVRFHKELVKLNEYDHAYVLLEFSLNDLLLYPNNTTLPNYIKRRIKIRGPYLMSILADLEYKYPNIRFVLAGSRAQEYCNTLLKKYFKLYQDRIDA